MKLIKEANTQLYKGEWRTFPRGTTVPEYLWTAVCTGNIKKVKEYFDKGNKPNKRYIRFGDEHSLIMGALRNQRYDMAKLLMSYGETILDDEKPEFDKFYADALKESKELKEDWNDFDKYEPIIDKYMQPSGEGDTLASQAVTAINKLVYKWFNDGDVYDNTYNLEGWANDLSSYANWLWKYLPDTRYSLALIEKAGGGMSSEEDDYEEILQLLCDLVLNDEFLDKYKDEPKQGSIYNCDGPFVFIDRPYDYDEDDEDDEYEWNKYYDEVSDWHDEHSLDA